MQILFILLKKDIGFRLYGKLFKQPHNFKLTNKMENQLSCGVSISIEKMKNKTVYIARCEELGISDFGDTPEEAIQNLRIGMKMLIEADPSKKEPLLKQKPLMTTRILL